MKRLWKSTIFCVLSNAQETNGLQYWNLADNEGGHETK